MWSKNNNKRQLNLGFKVVVMEDCKYLKTEDVTPWHGDVFDHPDYKHTCEKIGREIIPFIHCKRCKENHRKGENRNG